MPYSNFYRNVPYRHHGGQMMPGPNNRLVGGGFLGPFLLGGLTGGLVAPFFYGGGYGYGRPNYYYPNNYYPYYRPY